MGDFNAHFKDQEVGLDNRAVLLLNMKNVLGLHVMNWSQFAKGEFTWATKRKKSTLDYISITDMVATHKTFTYR